MTLEEFNRRLDELMMFGIKVGLENVTRLEQLCDQPSKKLKFIHLAGTNGKGSTGSMIEAGLRANGINTGFYTSPHLVTIRERMRICGELVDEPTLLLAASKVFAAIDSASDFTPTYFETVTVLALEVFVLSKVEYVVWETGMGGRWDATNFVTPEVSIITSIAMDHCSYLGEDLAAIAAEKAGIIKPNIPVFIGNLSKDAEAVIVDVAKERSAELHIFDHDFTIDSCSYSPAGTTFNFSMGEFSLAQHIKLLGKHQPENSALALAVIYKLFGAEFCKRASQGISQAIWPGRMQYFNTEQGEFIIDGAHNIEAMSSLIGSLKELFPNRKWSVCLGVLEEKNPTEIIKLLANIADKFYLLPIDNPRSWKVDDALEITKSLAVNAEISSVDSINSIIKTDKSPVLITGSLYLIGEIWQELFPES